MKIKDINRDFCFRFLLEINIKHFETYTPLNLITQEKLASYNFSNKEKLYLVKNCWKYKKSEKKIIEYAKRIVDLKKQGQIVDLDVNDLEKYLEKLFEEK